ncbi:Uncharacterised protein [Bordetella pertussis]|nr:Uncharacterised protein [Bordetella pertussis]
MWLDRPTWRTLPAWRRSSSACQYTSRGVPSPAGQCIWYRSMASTPSLRNDASTSRRRLSGAPIRRGLAMGSAGEPTRPPLVKT